MGFIIRGLGTVEPNGGAVLPLPWRERIAGAIRRARSLSFWPPHPAVALAPPAFRQRRAEAVYFIRRNGTGFGSGMWGCHALWSFTNRSLTVSTGNYDYNRTTNCGVRSDLWPPHVGGARTGKYSPLRNTIFPGFWPRRYPLVLRRPIGGLYPPNQTPTTCRE